MKILSLIVLLGTILFILPSPISALTEGARCNPNNNQCSLPLTCQKINLMDERGQPISDAFVCQNPIETVFGKISPPPQITALGPGSAGINNIINKIVQIIYVVAGIIFVFMIIISALQWIMSGGDKEAVGKARGRLTWAVIGIVFLALAFVIISVIGQITGFPFFVGQ